MSTIRWGIIGCGDVTEKKSGPGFQKADNSELIAVMRRNGKLAQDYAKRHNVAKWYDNADELINDPDVDAVYIATPPSTHLEYALAVSKSGKPVYVEKPMAMNYSECQKMIKACEAASVPLFVAYYRRALPTFLKIKSLIDEGAIGNVLCINISFYARPTEKDKDKTNWRINPDIAGCGYFCDLASHMFDLLQYYFGTINSVKGFTANQGKQYDAEDIVTANFTFETKGKIVFRFFTDEPFHLVRDTKDEEFGIKYPQHVQQPLIQKIVDDLLGKGKSPSTGLTGAKTNWVLDKILGRI
jgi:predicted dehydrogenase